MKQLKIFSLVFIISVFLAAIFCNPLMAQKVKLDAKGNYVAVAGVTKGSTATNTGKTYTDAKGINYPVMVSKNGKLFVVRTSKKTGNTYNQYLKTE